MSVVTGEAVALGLRVARAGSRALAFVIDVMVIAVLLLLAFFLWTQVVIQRIIDTNDVALAVALLLVLYVGTVVGYPVTMETTTRGRTLGKMAMGLRVVRDDGGPIRFRQAFVRGLVGFFELYVFSGIPALISSLASSNGKRVGDYLAGTLVLQERVPARAGPMAYMPPQLAGWAVSADLSGVNDAQALAIRQYLSRAHELHPSARVDMENRLANAVAAAISPPPPPGTPAWALLAAVGAERRRREEYRLQPPPTSAPASVAPAAQPSPQAQPPTSPSPPPREDGGFTLPN